MPSYRALYMVPPITWSGIIDFCWRDEPYACSQQGMQESLHSVCVCVSVYMCVCVCM